LVISEDCRPEEEYVVSHIPGAVRVDYKNDAEKILEKLPSKGNYYIPEAVQVDYQNKHRRS
jgi:3-mercaptopyruvate sulfurtransferase SseA